MRLPRMTTRRWMIAVAIVALIVTGDMMRGRSADYRLKARDHAGREEHLLRIADEQDFGVAGFVRKADELEERVRQHGDDPHEEGRLRRVARNQMRNAEKLHRFAEHTRQVAAFHGQLKRKYERALLLPWLSVEPDPPVPDEIPALPPP